MSCFRALEKPLYYIPVCRLRCVSFLQVGGIIVDVNLSEHSATIQFSEYHDGAAPFLIINHTKDQILQFHQRWENRTEREAIQGRVFFCKKAGNGKEKGSNLKY